MGYYTSYNLSIEYGEDSKKELFRAFQKQIELLEVEIEHLGAFDRGDAEDGYYGMCKWYDHDDDMLRLSAKFPDFLFILHGEGEDRRDLWYTYYKNGLYQYAHAAIVYDRFDPGKLVPPKNTKLFDQSEEKQ